MATANVKFTGSVIRVHVSIDATPVDLRLQGDSWVGSTSCSDGELTIEMEFTALTGTDWALVVKRDGKKLLDESDTSTAQTVEKTWDVGGVASILAMSRTLQERVPDGTKRGGGKKSKEVTKRTVNRPTDSKSGSRKKGGGTNKPGKKVRGSRVKKK